MAEIGSAFLSIVPSAKGIGSKLTADAAPEMQSSGSRLGSLLGGAIKKTLAVAGVAVGAAAGAALVGGFRSAIDQQNAAKVLTGLYGNADRAKIAMQGLANVAKTSPLDYSSYLKGAESLAYAGVQGNKAVQILKNVGLAITASGGNSENLGRATDAILSMVNAGKVQLDTLQQLSGAGVPILSGLAKKYGVTVAQINDLASDGKIKLQDVLSVMQKATGDTFQTMKRAGTEASKSFGNQFQIAKNNIFRTLGTALLPLLNKLAPVIGQIGESAVKGIGKLSPLFAKVGAALGRLDLSKLGAGIVATFSRLGGALSKINFSGSGKGASQFGQAMASIGRSIKSIDFGKLAAAVGDGIGKAAAIAAAAIGFLARHMDTIVKVLPFAIAGFAAYKVAQAAAGVAGLAQLPITAANAASNFALARALNATLAAQAASTGAETVGTVSRLRNTAATVAGAIAEKAAAIATKVFAAGQWLLNAALSANPIGLVVIAIAALVAGLIYAYKHSETFRNIVNSVFGFIKNFVVGAIGFVVGFVKNHWQLLLGIIGGPLGIIVGLVIKHFGAIRGFVTVAVAVIRAVIARGFNAARAVVAAVMGVIRAVVARGVGNALAVVRGVSAVAKIFASAFGRARDAVASGIGKVLGLVKSLPGKVRSAIGGLGSALYNSGRELIDGLIRGITSKLAAVAAKMHEVAAKVKGFLPGSPVKEGPLTSWNNGGAGKRLMGMLADGIDSGSPSAVASMRAASRSLAGGLSAPSLGLAGAGAGNGASSIDGARFRLVLDDGTPLTGHIERVADGVFYSNQALARQGR